MNKKGFTLIELVTVIALLSIIAVISIPKIASTIKETRADQLQEVREEVVSATEVYIKSNYGRDAYNVLIENNQVKLYLNVIVSCGLLKDKIYNPMNEEYFNIDDEYVIISIDEVGMIEYELSF